MANLRFQPHVQETDDGYWWPSVIVKYPPEMGGGEDEYANGDSYKSLKQAKAAAQTLAEHMKAQADAVDTATGQ